jgi:hypothetical protein
VGRTLGVDGADWRPGTYVPPDGLLTMVERGHINWVGILFRRAALETVAALDPQTAPSFDLDFELRLAARCPFVVCGQPGALMVQHQGSGSVAALLSDTWPAFLKIIDNTSDGAELPAALRQRVRAALERQLAGRLYRIGRAAARQGRVDEADRAAALIAQQYGWHRRASLIRAAARFCAAVAPARPALQLALDGYRLVRSRQLRTATGADYGTWVRS